MKDILNFMTLFLFFKLHHYFIDVLIVSLMWR